MVESTDVVLEADNTGNILLSNEQSFLITRLGETYSKEINVTYRQPRKVRDTITLAIATTTLSASRLKNLRLEELDGQFFITNECSHGEPVKFSVESEDVGHKIIKAIIDEFSPKPEPRIEPVPQPPEEKDDLNLSEEYWRANSIAEKFAPLILLSCAVLLSLSASFWLIFR